MPDKDFALCTLGKDTLSILVFLVSLEWPCLSALDADLAKGSSSNAMQSGFQHFEKKSHGA